ncbi:MAG: sigma-70 family RNA polymerase sigma factor [Flavobacteriales bacterium]|nr:sigma-70 family RNA polymerase sigma factor [Flavobacteriales bacterium]
MEVTQEKYTVLDDGWTEGLGRNDPGTIRALYADHFRSVRDYVLRNSGTVSDAQDVFQEAITVLWLAVKDGRIRTGTDIEPGGYLFRVSKYKWLDTVRSAAHKNMRVMKDSEAIDLPVEVNDGTDARIQRMREVYAGLDERCRTVLDQFYYGKKDLATIAAAMGVEEESIRTIKYRCMMKLRAFRQRIALGENGTEG